MKKRETGISGERDANVGQRRGVEKWSIVTER